MDDVGRLREALYSLRDSQGLPSADRRIEVAFDSLMEVLTGGHDALGRLSSIRTVLKSSLDQALESGPADALRLLSLGVTAALAQTTDAVGAKDRLSALPGDEK
jgi:hypothetical protein